MRLDSKVENADQYLRALPIDKLVIALGLTH